MAEVLTAKIPQDPDGKRATREMKDAGGPWKQVEWPGFYFDWKGVRTLSDQIGGGRGPHYGRTEFDYRNEFVWNLEATNMDSDTRYIPTNDAEAIIDCIVDHGLGFVIAKHGSEMDENGEFKQWNDKRRGNPRFSEILTVPKDIGDMFDTDGKKVRWERRLARNKPEEIIVD